MHGVRFANYYRNFTMHRTLYEKMKNKHTHFDVYKSSGEHGKPIYLYTERIPVNKLSKNLEKGGIPAAIIAVVGAIVENIPVIPVEAKPYVVAGVSGLIMGIINRIKHRR